MTVPTNLKYTAEHEWLLVDGDTATVGVTAHAAEALGDVVFLDLPAVGTAVKAGEPCGEIESTKSVSDVFAPCDGQIIEINGDAVADPGIVNLDPFGSGWLFRMTLHGDLTALEPDAYDSLVAGGA